MTALVAPEWAPDPAPEDCVDARLTQVLVRVTDLPRCLSLARILVARAETRWSGRADIAAFPPVRAWSEVAADYLGGVGTRPRRLLAALAAGQPPFYAGPAEALATVLMAHTGCPVTVTRVRARGGGRRVSIFTLGDDAVLAADLLEAFTTLGALDRLSTLTRWVALPRAAAPVSRLSRPVPAAGTPAA